MPWKAHLYDHSVWLVQLYKMSQSLMILTFLVIWDINHLKDVMRWETLTLPRLRRALCCAVVCVRVSLHTLTVSLLCFTLKSKASPLSLESFHLLCFSAVNCSLSSFSQWLCPSFPLSLMSAVILSISPSITQTLHTLLLDFCPSASLPLTLSPRQEHINHKHRSKHYAVGTTMSHPFIHLGLTLTHTTCTQMMRWTWVYKYSRKLKSTDWQSDIYRWHKKHFSIHTYQLLYIVNMF